MRVNFYKFKSQMVRTDNFETIFLLYYKKKKRKKYLGTGVAVAWNPVMLLFSGGLEFAAACLHRLYIV